MRKLLMIIAAVLCLCSCRTISSWVRDDRVVARVGDTKLYESEVESYIPDYVSSEDSLNLAMQYINRWATDLIYQEMASGQLSKEEMDVSKELEAYRRTLLRYRYEQRFVNDRLDTLIREEQIKAYYDAHPDLFMLERPILKVRFLDILKSNSSRKKIQTLMASSKPEDLAQAEELAAASAIRYYDNSDTWMDAAMLAKDFNMDYASMMAQYDDDRIEYEKDGGEILFAFVQDIRIKGVAPLEFCESAVRDYILSERKHALLGTLEQDLLKDALDRNKFVIY